jgi:hypothetical protein
MEQVINECTFQGITLLNKIRELYFIDALDKGINIIDTKFFRGVLILYSNEWEIRHGESMKTQDPDAFNIIKFLNRLKTKQKSEHNKYLLLRELVIKVLITILFNSKENFNDDTFKNIFIKFLPKYKSLYSQENPNENNEEEGDREDANNGNEEEENLNIGQMQSRAKINKKKYKNEIYNQVYGAIIPSLDKLLKIVDVGMDKIIEDFNKEINIIAKKLTSISGIPKNQNDDEDETILDSKAYLPISSFRSYLKPIYVDARKILKSGDEENSFDLYNYLISLFNYGTNIFHYQR